MPFTIKEMANRNANGSTNSNVNGSAKAGLPGDMDGTEDSVEFRLMMAYAQRRRPREVLCPLPQGTVTQPGGTETLEGHADTFIKKTKKKKKKKGMRMRLQRQFSCCIRTTKNTTTSITNGHPKVLLQILWQCWFDFIPSILKLCVCVSGSVGDELNEVVDRLTQIADGVSFSPWDLETDGEEGIRLTQPPYLGCIH
ncbi:unnamed protein product [Coregonus sp. 'balchen']|nr:unnamed protein product [Coregonus sp. 'balchen']